MHKNRDVADDPPLLPYTVIWSRSSRVSEQIIFVHFHTLQENQRLSLTGKPISALKTLKTCTLPLSPNEQKKSVMVLYYLWANSLFR